MSRRIATLAGILSAAACPLLADFSYQEKTTVTGGAMAGMMKVAGVFSKQAREPIESTIAVKGDKMVHRGAHRFGIIDLASQTITEVDLQKKTYTVITFEQMKQMMQQMAQKMHQQDPNQPQMTFKVSANKTGNTKQIAGMDARELVLKMEMESTDEKSGQKGSMVITTDMWITAAADGYAEVRDFQRRMAEKINWSPSGNMFMARPDISQGMAEVNKEIGKLDGMPILEVVSMGAAGQPGAAGSEGTAQPQAQPTPQPDQQQQQQAKPSVGGALGGALGGRFGLGRKRTQDTSSTQSSSAPPPSGGNASSGNAGPGSLLEMTVERSGFSAAPVDSSLFSVPAGFKQVEPDTRRMQ